MGFLQDMPFAAGGGWNLAAFLVMALSLGGLAGWLIGRRGARPGPPRSGEAVSASQDRLVKLAEVVPGALYSFRMNLDGSVDFPYVGPRMEGFSGVPMADLQQDAWTVLRYVHPEDLPLILESIAESARTLTPWNCEFQMSHPQKGEVWIEGHSSPVRELGGGTVWHGIFMDITERKRIEEEYLRADGRLRAIIDAAPFGAHSFHLEPDGRLVFVGFNASADRIFGIRHAELLGRTLEEAFPNLVGTGIPEAYRQVASEGKGVESEQVFSAGDRIQGAFEIHAFQTVPHQMTVFFSDITERKKAEEQLAQERVFTNAVMDSVPGLLYVYDAEGHLVRWNKQHETITGYSNEELSRMTLMDWYRDSPEDIDRIALAVQKALLEGYAEEEGNLQTKFGTRILFRFTAVRLEIEGKIYFAGIGIDITARKKAEREILRLNESLEERVRHRTAELEVANREMESFSYSVSHDLRTPLRAMDGFSLALLEDYGESLNPEARRFVDQVRQGAKRMNSLIEDLLRLSRLGRSALHRQQVDMGALVREVIEELRIPEQAPRVELRLAELPSGMGDPSLLKQVWINLISNALKYSQNRGPACIEVGCDQEGQGAVFFVRDNGVGFDMKYAPKLFQVFQRLHGHEAFEGNGVGLALVRQIVSRHGGRVWAEGQLDEGACFRFTLNEPSKGTVL